MAFRDHSMEVTRRMGDLLRTLHSLSSLLEQMSLSTACLVLELINDVVHRQGEVAGSRGHGSHPPSRVGTYLVGKSPMFSAIWWRMKIPSGPSARKNFS